MAAPGVKAVLVTVVGIFLTGCTTTLPPAPPSWQTEHVLQNGALHYLLYQPAEYESSSRSWPLILFLHGSGERGEDLRLVKREGLPRWLDRWQHFPFVVVSPQCPRRQDWSIEALTALLDEILATRRINEERIYVTGLSTGAVAALKLAIRHPDRFAAIAAVTAHRIPENLCAIRATPIRIFHNSGDERVPVQKARDLAASVKACGGEIVLTVYPGEGHDSWTRAYDERALYDWFLEHRRRKLPSQK